MQTRSKWLLPVSVIVIIAVGITFLWSLRNATAERWWHHSSASVLSLAIPPLVALLAWFCKQMISARQERSTPEQLSAARQTLIGRGREWWRGVPEPAWPGHPLRAGLKPLDVTWAKPSSDHPYDDGPVYGSSGDIPGLVGRFKAIYPCRLVIKGSAGSGKSVLARMMMAELLKDPQPGDPVPVFLPLWSWSPREERFYDWVKRQIAHACPELADEVTYGPTAVANLVDQGGVLPILDGLDSLPERNRRAVLDDGHLLSQDRLILTYRGTLDKANGFTVIEPREIDQQEACRFLTEVTGQPASSFSYLPDHLSDPRTVYLASIVQQGTEKNEFGDDKATKDQLLEHLIPALMRADDDWAPPYPWYTDRAEDWLADVADLNLLDTDNHLPGTDNPGHKANRDHHFDPDDPGDSRIAWWNLYRAIRWLHDHQAVFRALIIGFLTFGLITLDFRTHALIFKGEEGWRYSLMTAGAYGLVIFVAGVFFGRGDSDVKLSSGKFLGIPSRWLRKTVARLYRYESLKIPFWWLCNKSAHWGQIVLAGIWGFILFGVMIGIRTGLSSGRADGIRTGFWDGLLQGFLIIILTFLIAGVPAPPRTTRAVDRGVAATHGFGAFVRAMVLGISFGVLWGSSIALKSQHPRPRPHLQAHAHITPITPITPVHEDIVLGIIVGINFALGAWFFRWARAQFRSTRSPDPRSASRTDIIGTALCSLILGVTFGISFGLNAPAGINFADAVAWFVVGAAMAILGSEWPLYAAAISWLSLKKRKLPFRLLIFLECCRVRGIVRVVGQEYQFYDDDMLKYLSRVRERRQTMPSSRAADFRQDEPGGGAEAVGVSAARR